MSNVYPLMNEGVFLCLLLIQCRLWNQSLFVSAWFLVISWESGFVFTSSMMLFEHASCYWFAWLFSRSWRHSPTFQTNKFVKISQKSNHLIGCTLGLGCQKVMDTRCWSGKHISLRRSWVSATAGSDKCWCAAAAEEGRVATFWIC